MRGPCNDCPFVKENPKLGSPEWLGDVIMGHRGPGFSHTCHKTDPKADGFVGGKTKLLCAGFERIKENRRMKTPGAGGVYESLDVMIEEYLVHWLGRDLFEKCKAEAELKRLGLV